MEVDNWFYSHDLETNTQVWTGRILVPGFNKGPPGYQFVRKESNYWTWYGANFPTVEELLAWLQNISKDRDVISSTRRYATEIIKNILAFLSHEPLERSEPL